MLYHHHDRIFDYHAGAGTSSTSVVPLLGIRLTATIADLTADLQVPPPPACHQSVYHMLF